MLLEEISDWSSNDAIILDEFPVVPSESLKPRSLVAFAGVGQSRIAVVLEGSVAIPSWEMMWLR